MNGISGYMNRLWSLQQHILLRWGVYTVFEEQCPIVPMDARGWIHWHVPLDVPACEEIMAFVKHELADLNTPDRKHPSLGTTFPGTDVEVRAIIISRFNGIEPYVERDVLESMARKALERVMKKLGVDKADLKKKP